tara:strand:- start:140 stop:652 length:513 start_codon:yes stop_codon:yes gene_type:complete
MKNTNLSLSPCEAHAIAIGICCGIAEDKAKLWEEGVYSDLEAEENITIECRSYLDKIFSVAADQLKDISFSFQLWLPQETESVVNEATAIKNWAQGFLYGFGLASRLVNDKLSQESREALKDFYDIGQLSTNLEGSEDENQIALTEIEEYMRVAVMLIYEDVRSIKNLEN